MKGDVIVKISFLGAAKEVTGLCYLVETEKTKFLVDLCYKSYRGFMQVYVSR
jgi:predicted metal-dependent RNase